MEFSERNKRRVTSVAGTAERSKIGFRAAEDGIGRKTVSLSERAAEGQRKGEYGCRRALPSGSGFGRTYCRRFVCCACDARTAAFFVEGGTVGKSRLEKKARFL